MSFSAVVTIKNLLGKNAKKLYTLYRKTDYLHTQGKSDVPDQVNFYKTINCCIKNYYLGNVHKEVSKLEMFFFFSQAKTNRELEV